MIERDAEDSQSLVLAKKIALIVEQHKRRIGSYDVKTIGNIGFLLQNEQQIPAIHDEWLLFDFDDALVGTTEVKNKRLELYRQHLKELGIEISDDSVKFIMKLTDRFSRWEDYNEFGQSYHANCHMSSLYWVTCELIKVKNRRSLGENITETDILTGIENTLVRIKSQLDGIFVIEPSDPFYFRNKDRLLVLKDKTPWSRDIENIFSQTMFNPPPLEEVLSAGEFLSNRSDLKQDMVVGIFTYGEPDYQLLKIFELLEHNPNLIVNQIWLSRVPKGSFIKEYVITTDIQPFVILVVDDNPSELESISSAGRLLQDFIDVTLVPIRLRSRSSKAVNKEWDHTNPYRELDFRNRKLSAIDIVKTLQINRYISLRNLFGANHHRVEAFADVLMELGITQNEMDYIEGLFS